MENLNGLLDSGTVLNGAVISKLTVNGQVSIGRTFETIPIEDAEAGQIVQISEVDENGKPTAWAAIDIPKASDRVSYVEAQLLTDAQRAQARENISRYEWHTVTIPSNKAQSVLAAFDPYFNHGFDWSIADSVMSSTSWGQTQGYTAFEDLLDCIQSIRNGSRSTGVVSDCVSEIETLINAGAWLNSSQDGLTFIEDRGGVIEELCRITKQDNLYTVVAYSNTEAGFIQVRHDTKIGETRFTKMFMLDKTLTESSSYADAKVVGDALSGKADKTQIVNADWNETDETALSFIDNKPKIATDEDIMGLLFEIGMVVPVTAADGSILISSTGEIYSL